MITPRQYRPPIMLAPRSPEATPVGPSGPLRQVYPVIDHIPPPFVSLHRNTRYGRGVLVPVAVGNQIAANTPFTVTHNLGRLVGSALVYTNNGGQLINPALEVGTGTRIQQTLQADNPLLNALIWFY